MDDNWTLMKEGQPGTLSRGEFLASSLEPGSTIGVDPFLMTTNEWTNLTKAVEGSNMKLVSVKNNLIDAVWGSNQPDRPNQPILPLEMKFTGKSWLVNISRCIFIFSCKKHPFFSGKRRLRK